MNHGFTLMNSKLNNKNDAFKECKQKTVAAFFRKTRLVEVIPHENRQTVITNWYIEVCLLQVSVKSDRCDRLKSGMSGILFHHDMTTRPLQFKS